MTAILGFCLRDLFRSRFIVAYFLFYLASGYGLMSYAPTSSAGFGALLSLVLFLVPLCALVFGVLYFYQARGFHELILAQPVGRATVLSAQGLSLALALGTAFVLGLGIPTASVGFRNAEDFRLMAIFLGGGLLLHLCFLALAFLIALSVEDRLRGFAAALFLWLMMVFLYDGILLFLLIRFSDFPLDRVVIGAILLNPVDLERILVLMQLDTSVLLGYTGAVFRHFFGAPLGGLAALGAMVSWIIIPLAIFFRNLRKKDF